MLAKYEVNVETLTLLEKTPSKVQIFVVNNAQQKRCVISILDTCL